MEGANPYPTCDEGIHAVVYDPRSAEFACSHCGLVFDEMKLDPVMECAAKRKRALHLTANRAAKRSVRHQSLESSLQEMLSQQRVEEAVQEKALDLCQAVRKQRFRAGHDNSTLSNALVYTASRLCRIPVSLAGHASASATERKRVARCYQRICRYLELSIPRFDGADYLPHLATKLRIPDSALSLARTLLARAKERRLTRGANPIGMAAAAVYVACNVTGRRITQRELAIAARVSDVTIRGNSRILVCLIQARTPAASPQTESLNRDYQVTRTPLRNASVQPLCKRNTCSCPRDA